MFSEFCQKAPRSAIGAHYEMNIFGKLEIYWIILNSLFFIVVPLKFTVIFLVFLLIDVQICGEIYTPTVEPQAPEILSVVRKNR